jgi:hypothetical protein
MWHLCLLSFLSGLFAANGIPHFINGGLGQKHQTPFSKSSSAIVNVCWGWFNLVVAAFALHFAHMWAHEYRAIAFFAVGALVITLFNASIWSKRPSHK